MTRVFTPQTIGPELIATDERIRAAVVKGLRGAARLGRGEVVKQIRGNKPFPVVDLAELIRSPKVTNIPEGAELEVMAPHGIYQEFGTGPAAGNAPFTPPFEAILAWALRKGRGAGASSKKKPKKRPRRKRRSLFGKELIQDVARSIDRRRAKALAAAGKKSRSPGKKGREAGLSDATEGFASAVWMSIRRHGGKPKRFYERASRHFQRHVDERVTAAVAKVRN